MEVKQILSIKDINPNVIKASYAVRGPLAIRAEELKDELKSSNHNYPFDSVTFCNIGNPQQLGQPPLTLYRQVLAILEYPQLLENGNQFPADVVMMAKQLLKGMGGGSTGAYSHSQGHPFIRERVCRWIESRDSLPHQCIDKDEIFLTNGASDGVNRIMNCLIGGEGRGREGVLIPIPQYPLYSALLTLVGAEAVGYYLEEEDDWGFSMVEVKRAWTEACQKGIKVKAFCLINPGNPTGACLAEERLREIVDFCYSHSLVLLADEVYQENIYGEGSSFCSARRATLMSGLALPVISFHSISKGLIGECGHRGGYFDCLNVDAAVLEQLYKVASISLCANVPGQVLVYLMSSVPPANDGSSAQNHKKELKSIFDSLKGRGKRLADALNCMPGITCRRSMGALYLFPSISFPLRFIDACEEAKKCPDQEYAMRLLNATGICVVPGSGFGQRPGSWHVRTTFLPNDIDVFVERWGAFHARFMDLHS